MAHPAELARPGGAVYLVDTDLTGLRIRPTPAELHDMTDRYVEFQEQRGNDITIGASLGILLEDAGLEVDRFRFGGPVFRLPTGTRGPPWAARDAMVGAGIVSEDDVARWGAGFTKLDADPYRPWMVTPVFVAVGRRPG